jgi:hypothetical protein
MNIHIQFRGIPAVQSHRQLQRLRGHSRRHSCTEADACARTHTSTEKHAHDNTPVPVPLGVYKLGICFLCSHSSALVSALPAQSDAHNRQASFEQVKAPRSERSPAVAPCAWTSRSKRHAYLRPRHSHPTPRPHPPGCPTSVLAGERQEMNDARAHEAAEIGHTHRRQLATAA